MLLKCFRSTVTNPYLNLAIEDWIFRTYREQKMILFLWRNSPAVVIGRNQNPWTECDMVRMKVDGIPLVRRQSGGGTVYHDLGNTNFSIMMPRSEFNMTANAKLVANAISSLDIAANVNKRNDIVVSMNNGIEYKVSGSAYRVISDRAFHHGTMLVDANLDHLKTYLNTKDKFLLQFIESRAVKSVKSPVMNLSQASLTVDHLSVCQSIAFEFMRSYDKTFQKPSFEYIVDGEDVEIIGESECKEKHIQTEFERLTSWPWIIGQTPDFYFRMPGTTERKRIHRGEIEFGNGKRQKFDEFLTTLLTDI